MQYEPLRLLKKDELRTVRKSKREFRGELSFLRKTSELFLRTFNVLSDIDYHFTYSKEASFRISYRIFRILRCAFKVSLEGYYDTSMALLRVAYENHLLVNYLSKNEREAELWFKGKTFKPTFLKENVSYASDSLYRKMCEFIHSSFKSTLAFTITEDSRTKATLGEYDKEQFRTVLLLLLMTMTTTIIWLSLTFAEELMRNGEWHSMFKETVPKTWKYLKEYEKAT